MKNLFCIIAFLFATLKFYGTETVSLNGKVLDEKNNPVVYANVILINNSDSSVVKAALSDDDGKYKFDEVENGTYRVLIAQLGYSKIYSDPIVANSNPASINVPTISLISSAINLQEATVTAMKPFIEHRIDRTIVNVENSIVSAGATALEILKRSPGVTIDNDGNIILSGKQGVLVMMDGKPTYLSQRDLYEQLRNMSSDQLSLIEIITNPSSKYDAAGTSGIINIKLRKKQHTGFNGRANLSYGQGVFPDLGGGLNLNYGSEKFNLFSGYDYFNGFYFEKINMSRKFAENGYSSSFVQHSYDKGHFINNNFRIGADFFPSKKTTVGFIVRGSEYVNHDRTESATDIFNNKVIADSGYVTYNSSDSRWANISGNINYRYQIDTLGREISADADYAKYSSSSDYSFITDNFYSDSPLIKSEIATDKQPAKIDIRTFKIDYTHPLSKTMKIEAGAKTSHVKTDNDVVYYNYVSDVPILDTGKTNHFKYTENINAAYINWSQEYGKFGVQAGLRGEQTIADGTQLADNSNFTRNYFQLFPTLFLNYKFNDKHQVNASYSRRINRPEYGQLNPFKYFIDPYNYQEGNPFLEPQLTNSFELSYTYLQMFTIAFNYSHTIDAMTQITKQIDSTRTTFVTTENLDSYDNYGVNLSLPIKITEWLQSTNNFNFFNNSYKGMSSVGAVDKNLSSYTFNSTNSITLPKGITAEVLFWYNSEMVWGTWLVEPQYSLGGGLSKMFLNERLQFRININDILHTEITKSTIAYQNINADFKKVDDTQFVRFHFAYKFGKQMQRSRARRSGAEEEQNRVRQGH